MIDLDAKQLEIVNRILDAVVPDAEVRAFGSRVRGTAREYSDLDLALVSSDAITRDRIEALKDAFALSDLPFQVDVLDWHEISPAFRAVIEDSFEVVREARSKNESA